MSDLTASKDRGEGAADAHHRGPWPSLRKLTGRLSDWFVIQSTAVKLRLVVVALLIPMTASYSFVLWQRQAAVAEQVRAMSGETGSEALWTLNDKLPVVFGTGSVLGFLESRPVDRITVIYKALMWNVSERIVLIESQGKQFAYYPSDNPGKFFIAIPETPIPLDDASDFQALHQRRAITVTPLSLMQTDRAATERLQGKFAL